MTGGPRAAVGVFGGSGFTSFLDDVEQVAVDTPWGRPSAPVSIGSVGDTRVAFLPRHGEGHVVPPHRVPFRANVWALRSLGVERVFGPCAVGSLRTDMEPGHFVVVDQLVDRTTGREASFYDGPDVHHVSFADPYCPHLRTTALDAARAEGVTTHDGGTVVVIPGPRFSTRAESRWYRAMGWDLVNMTQHPEAYLARELGLCYASIALVTDYDTGVEDDPGVEPVTIEEVFAVMRSNVDAVRTVLFRAIGSLGERATDCGCASAAHDTEPAPPA